MPFAALGLIPELTRALTDRGYSTPTPVQARVIPEILAGRDVLAGAQTGTGKTAGFTLPILQRLQGGSPSKAPRVLILVPTRELAAQVNESIQSYGKYLRQRSLVIFGGVSINPQIDALRRGADILVATPGRLLDHVQQGTMDLSRIEIFVLDEADRMLDMGFIADIRRVIKQLPKTRQNLLFSATYSEDIRRLAQTLLRDPIEIEVARRNAAVDTVEQRAYMVAKDQKRALLSHLIQDGDWSQVLVFTRTKHGANRLTKQLQQDGIEASAINGNKSQSARIAALADFKNYRIRALVATEVASRGLDIKELPYVVNYELPNVPEDYVHRIGRTGRAGATGVAVSLVASDESGLLKDIEKVLRKPVPHAAVPHFKPAPPAMREESRERPAQQSRSQDSHRPRHANQTGAPRPAGENGQRRRKRRGGGAGGQPQQPSHQAHSGGRPNSAPRAQRPAGGQHHSRPQQGQHRSGRSRPNRGSPRAGTT
ncbi:MAG: DEAD/DEAH box helicase [Steroidobacter sp.]